MPAAKIRGREKSPGRLGPSLGALLVEARGSRTRAEVAREAGVHVNVLGDLEQGRANPTLAYLEAVGPFYGIELRLVAVATDA